MKNRSVSPNPLAQHVVVQPLAHLGCMATGYPNQVTSSSSHLQLRPTTITSYSPAPASSLPGFLQAHTAVHGGQQVATMPVVVQSWSPLPTHRYQMLPLSARTAPIFLQPCQHPASSSGSAPSPSARLTPHSAPASARSEFSSGACNLSSITSYTVPAAAPTARRVYHSTGCMNVPSASYSIHSAPSNCGPCNVSECSTGPPNFSSGAASGSPGSSQSTLINEGSNCTAPGISSHHLPAPTSKQTEPTTSHQRAASPSVLRSPDVVQGPRIVRPGAFLVTSDRSFTPGLLSPISMIIRSPLSPSQLNVRHSPKTPAESQLPPVLKSPAQASNVSPVQGGSFFATSGVMPPILTSSKRVLLASAAAAIAGQNVVAAPTCAGQPQLDDPSQNAAAINPQRPPADESSNSPSTAMASMALPSLSPEAAPTSNIKQSGKRLSVAEKANAAPLDLESICGSDPPAACVPPFTPPTLSTTFGPAQKAFGHPACSSAAVASSVLQGRSSPEALSLSPIWQVSPVLAIEALSCPISPGAPSFRDFQSPGNSATPRKSLVYSTTPSSALITISSVATPLRSPGSISSPTKSHVSPTAAFRGALRHPQALVARISSPTSRQRRRSTPPEGSVIEWPELYIREVGRAPATAEQLRAFVINRGGQLPWCVARQYVPVASRR